MRYDYYEKNNGKYEFTFMQEIEKKDTDIYIITRQGQRMDTLAFEKWGDSKLWWVIARANNLSGDSVFLESGKRIRIPFDISEIVSNLIRGNDD